jgi:hypothetical protein
MEVTAQIREQVQLVRKTYTDIYTKLKELRKKLDKLNSSEGVQDAANQATVAALKQMISQTFQYEVQGKLAIVAGISEPFWVDYSWKPESHFHTRKMPGPGVKPLDRPTRVDADTIVKDMVTLHRITNKPSEDSKTPETKMPKSEQVRARRDRYDVRELIVVSANATPKSGLLTQVTKINNSEVRFFSGEVEDRYRPASIATYNDSLTEDLIGAIMKLCREMALYSSMLAVYQNIAASPINCHLAFCRPVIEQLFPPHSNPSDLNKSDNPFLEMKYLHVIHHAQHYALTLLHREEAITNGWAHEQHRFVLDPEVLEMIPRVNYPAATHPWVPMCLNAEQMINPESPLRHEEADQKYRGFHSTEVFRIRADIFNDGNLNGLNMDGLYIVGSIIPSCLIRSPLELQFGIECDRTDLAYWQQDDVKLRLRRYFNEFYPSKEILSGWDNISPDDLIELEDELTDIDIVVRATEEHEYRRIVTRIYETIRKNLLKKFPVLEREDLQILEMKTARSIKYYISGRCLGRSYEVFRFREDERAISGVSRFHFPSVRAMYDGYKIQALPSCWVYATTGVMTGYRWFSFSDTFVSGVMKYYSRGGYLPLNTGEIDAVKQYLATKDAASWIHLGKFAKLGFNHPVFHPREQGIGLHGKYRSKDDGGVLPSGMSLIKHHDYQLYDVAPSTVAWPVHLTFRYPHGNIIPWNNQYGSKEVRDLIFSKKHQLPVTTIGTE